MSDLTEQLAAMKRRLDESERELADLRQRVSGMVPTKLLPSAGGLEGQVSVLQSSMAGMFAQNAFVAAGNTREAEDDGAVITDIEYGLVKEVPDSTPSATIVLRPCDANGTEYASADDVTVYVRRDRSSINQVGFGWKTSTILTWLRFASVVGSSPAVSGVVIGGDEAGPGTPTVVCGPASPSYDRTLVVTDNLGRVAGWYDYKFCIDTWTWDAGPWGYSDPKLRPVVT